MNFDPIQSLTITVVTGANRILGRVTGVTASRQNRERWSLILKREGCTEYTVNGRKLLSDNLHPILLPKGSSYLWRCIQPGEYITIDFNADETLKEPLSFAVVDNKPLIHAFTQIEQSLYRQDSSSSSARSMASASTPAVRKMGSWQSWQTKLSSTARTR